MFPRHPLTQDWFDGVFPKDTPRNMRFSINFFTSIGLGGAEGCCIWLG